MHIQAEGQEAGIRPRGPGDETEAARLNALVALEILDSAPESEFNDLTELAALALKAPAALITLVDSDRQWFKASVGLDVTETPRDISFCDHAIRSDDILVVLDTDRDARFSENPMVTHAPGIRFYAGAPLVTPDGYRVGTLCIVDFKPRKRFSQAHRDKLTALAASLTQVMIQRAAALRSARLAATACATAELLELAEQTAKIGTWVYDVATTERTWSKETYRMFGFDPEKPAPDHATVMSGYHPDDAAKLTEKAIRAIRQGVGYENQGMVFRRDGVQRHIATRAFPRFDETGKVVALYGTVQDITEIRLADAALHESEARLRSLNWALTAYGRSTSALLHNTDLNTVLSQVCEAIVADDAYLLAAVALADPLPSKDVNVAAGAGQAVGYLDDLKLSWSADVDEGRGPSGIAMRSREPQVVRDSRTDPVYAPWRGRGIRFGIRSSLTVPLIRDDRVLGVLLVYAANPDAFSGEEIGLFQKLAEELIFSIALAEGRARLAASLLARAQAEEAEAKAREQLVESEARYRALTEQLPDIVIRYNMEGVIEYASRAVRKIGYEPEQVVGANIADFRVVQDGGASPTLAALSQGLPMPSGALNEIHIACPDGREVWLQGCPAALYDDDGEPIGVVSVLRDVTDRRDMEAELRRKQAEAEAAAVAKAQFLANMSHEIRTPLTGVLGFAGLLAGVGDLPPTARTYIDRITSGSQALLAIVNDVLDFSRLEDGKIELDRQPHDLSPMLDEAVDLLANDAAKKGIQIHLERRGDLPAAVTVDSGRLRQVLLNLLGNAIKFTETGSVTLAASHDADSRLRIEVTDTGRGISAEHVDRLFRRFSQVDGSNTREFGGAGLGLAISKGLVEAMGGDIGVESAEGRGSTFWFTIDAPVAERCREIRPAQPEAWAMPSLRILVVDDVAVNRELISAMLAQFDIEITEAANGSDAVEAAMYGAFDLILMDLQMPGMDGLAATRAIRANSELNRATPILAVSANVMPSHVETCLQAGMNDHVGKPISPGDLLGKIARWTEPQPAEQAAAG